jgi:hypothetical protein
LQESRIGSESNCDEFRIVWIDALQTNGVGSSGSAPGTSADSRYILSRTFSFSFPNLLSAPTTLKSAKREGSTVYTVGLPPAQLAALFPFHFIFNRHLELVQYGPSLAKILVSAIAHGKKASPLFQVVEPSQASDWTFQDAESW